MKPVTLGLTLGSSEWTNSVTPENREGESFEEVCSLGDYPDSTGVPLCKTMSLHVGLNVSYNGKNYTVERSIGDGGEARAWSASALDGERVVLKVAHQPWNQFTLENLLRAIELRERLTHIPDDRLARLSIVDQQHSLTVQNYAGDQDLESYLKGRSFPDRVRYLFHTALSSVLSTVGRMHSEPFSVVHRDLKPSNCVVANNGNICIVDTGHLVGHDQVISHLMTPLYASPRILERQFPFRLQDDLYALGIFAFRTLLGDDLFGQFAPHAGGKIPSLQSHHKAGTFFSYGFGQPDFISYWTDRIVSGLPNDFIEEVRFYSTHILSVGRALIVDPTVQGAKILREPESFLRSDSGWTLAPSSFPSEQSENPAIVEAGSSSNSDVYGGFFSELHP